jgi:adenylate cyclase
MGKARSLGLQRRLAAIMAVDVAGSSRLIEANEGVALSAIQAILNKVLRPSAAKYGGRVVKTLGDGALLEFASPVLAVRCAVEVQEIVDENTKDEPEATCVRLRIGINIGDVRVGLDGDVFGDGVNVAARLETLAEPGGVCVAGKVYDELEGKLALPFADSGEQFLKGISRSIRVFSLKPGRSSAREPKAVWRASDNAERPSIAVLPFTNLSGDLEQEYFADGIADDVLTALSKSRWLFVMGRSSAFVFKGKALEIGDVGRKLGVRYILSGSVRRSTSHVRVAAQLVDAENGESVWAERYDRDLTDMLVLQDEIAEAVAAAIEPELLRKEGERGFHRPQSLNAWDLVRRGMWHFHRFTAEGHEAARHLFTRATEVDPNASGGYIWLARTEGGRCSFGWTRDRAESLRVAHSAADRAVQIDAHNPYSHYAVAAACNGSADFAMAARAARHATVLNPTFALGHLILGAAVLHSGNASEAVDHLERGLRLSPYDPQHFTWLFHLSWAYQLSNRLDQGLITAQHALALRPGWASGFKAVAAAALALGDLQQAVDAWQQAAVASDTGADLMSLLKRSHPSVVERLEQAFSPR